MVAKLSRVFSDSRAEEVENALLGLTFPKRFWREQLCRQSCKVTLTDSYYCINKKVSQRWSGERAAYFFCLIYCRLGSVFLQWKTKSKVITIVYMQGTRKFLIYLTSYVDFYIPHLGRFRKDDTPCPAVTTPPDFNLNLYTSKRWYVHQLAPTQYVPVERNYCAYADYSILEKKTFPWSYELSVSNYAENKEREQFGGPLCGFVDDPDNQAKLKVAPCFLPKSVAGNWL